MNLEELRRAGISRGPLGLVTNRVRPILWRLLLPYLERITSLIGRLEHSVGTLETRLAATDDMAQRHEGKFTEVDAGLQEASVQPALLIGRLGTRIAGLQKDLLASNHRMTSIEDMIDDGPAALAALSERADGQAATLANLQEAVEELRRRPVVESAGPGLSVITGPMGRFMVRPQDLIGGIVATGGVWEPHVRAAIERHADRNRDAVDAGAYIGLHTVLMARNFRRVHAFEPQTAVFQVLCGNVALNACGNVDARELALYDRACTMRLAPPERQEIPVPIRDGDVDYDTVGNAAGLMFEVQDDGIGPVRALPLDGVGLGDVGLIKVDAQGADLHVLRGASETILRCRPVVLFEYERDMAAAHHTSHGDLLAFFEALNYDVQVLCEVTPERQIDYIATPR
jgi:FkbM family methyltransferase